MTARIPLSTPDITETEIDAPSAVLRSQYLNLGSDWRWPHFLIGFSRHERRYATRSLTSAGSRSSVKDGISFPP